MKMTAKYFGLVAVLLLPACGGTTGGGGGGPKATPTAVDLCTSLGAGVQAASCSTQGPTLGAKVDAAIDLLVTQRPELFDKTNELNAGAKDYLILDVKGFLNGVAANLNASGACAQVDTFNDHRLKVKSTAGLSEDYNVTTIDYGEGSHLQKSPTSYDISCQPASFPLERNPDVPPPDQHCGQPYPPQIGRFSVKVFSKNGGLWILDSTPQILIKDYCFALGYQDGRSFCPIRPEGKPERVFCEGWRVGKASDTGLLGPTWTRDGKPCTGPDSGCANYPHNQFQLQVFEGDGATHTYQACTDLGFCGSFDTNH
jgi:hypothetical protein